MNRILTLASTGLFAAGLAILPLSVHAAAPTTETKAPVTAPVVAGPDGKAAPAAAASTAKDATKPGTTTASPVTPAKPATTSAPAKAGG